MWRKENPPELLLGCKLVQPLWRTVWRYLGKLYIELPYDPAVTLLGIYPDKTLLKNDTCTCMFIVALFTIHGNNPNVHGQMIGLGRCIIYIHNRILLTHQKEQHNDITATWMELEILILSEVS